MRKPTYYPNNTGKLPAKAAKCLRCGHPFHRHTGETISHKLYRCPNFSMADAHTFTNIPRLFIADSPKAAEICHCCRHPHTRAATAVCRYYKAKGLGIFGRGRTAELYHPFYHAQARAAEDWGHKIVAAAKELGADLTLLANGEISFNVGGRSQAEQMELAGRFLKIAWGKPVIAE